MSLAVVNADANLVRLGLEQNLGFPYAAGTFCYIFCAVFLLFRVTVTVFTIITIIIIIIIVIIIIIDYFP